jgi:hypothetical protein
MIKKVPLTELESRMRAFRKRMDTSDPDWKIALSSEKVIKGLFCISATLYTYIVRKVLR